MINTDFTDTQKWYAKKCNKTVAEFDDYDNHLCKVAYDYATELVKNNVDLGDVTKRCYFKGCNANVVSKSTIGKDSCLEHWD